MLEVGATMGDIRRWGYIESEVFGDDPDSFEEF